MNFNSYCSCKNSRRMSIVTVCTEYITLTLTAVSPWALCASLEVCVCVCEMSPGTPEAGWRARHHSHTSPHHSLWHQH